eukprot:COSAG02_NODE_16055_length_1117_cov_1.192534_2_plen_174_part_00
MKRHREEEERKREEAKRQREEEAKRTREEKAKREEEAKRTREEEERKRWIHFLSARFSERKRVEEAKRKREEEAKRTREEKAKRKREEKAMRPSTRFQAAGLHWSQDRSVALAMNPEVEAVHSAAFPPGSTSASGWEIFDDTDADRRFTEPGAILRAKRAQVSGIMKGDQCLE